MNRVCIGGEFMLFHNVFLGARHPRSVHGQPPPLSNALRVNTPWRRPGALNPVLGLMHPPLSGKQSDNPEQRSYPSQIASGRSPPKNGRWEQRADWGHEPGTATMSEEERARRRELETTIATWLMGVVLLLAVVGLGYTVLFIESSPYHPAQRLFHVFIALGGASLISLLAYGFLGVSHRRRLDPQCEECRRLGRGPFGASPRPGGCDSQWPKSWRRQDSWGRPCV
jgi:hypothetical protein